MFIGADFGTQGVRCGVVSGSGEIIKISECKYHTVYPHEGWAEQKPADWLTSFNVVLNACIGGLSGEQRKNMQGISVCTTASTVIPVDKDGAPLSNAIVWMDIRAKKEARMISDTQSPTLRYSGSEVSPEWLLPKVLWLKHNQKDIYNRAYRIVELQDFINHYLTGKWTASLCQASCKAAYVESSGQWDRDLMNAIGLEDFESKLNTEIKNIGDKIGNLRPEIADELGLSGIPVFQGGIDAHISMLGIGVCREGDLGIVMGTSFVHLALTKEPAFSDGLWGPYKSVIVPGLYCSEGGQTSAGSITKWFVREFQIGGDDAYKRMSEDASLIDPGCNGLVALDFFHGNRTPYKDPFARGVFFGLTLAHTRAHLYRAVMESVAFGTRNIVEHMKAAGISIGRVFACGGITKNPMQMIADVNGCDLRLTRNSQYAGILGCGVVAACGSGLYGSLAQACGHMIHIKDVIKSNKIVHSQYNAPFDLYKDVNGALKPLYIRAQGDEKRK